MHNSSLAKAAADGLARAGAGGQSILRCAALAWRAAGGLLCDRCGGHRKDLSFAARRSGGVASSARSQPLARSPMMPPHRASGWPRATAWRAIGAVYENNRRGHERPHRIAFGRIEIGPQAL